MSFSCQVMPDSLRPHGLPVAQQASLPFSISRSLLKLMSIELMMLSNRLILYCPLLLLPSIFPSIRVFSSELAFHIRWPKYWIFSFSISPSSEYSELISLRIDWFRLLAVQGTLKSSSFYLPLPEFSVLVNVLSLFLTGCSSSDYQVPHDSVEWREHI